MTDQELFQRNMDLQTAFIQYTLSHPEILDKLPTDYQLVILPEDEPELVRRNQELLEKQKFNKPIVVVRMKSPEPAKLKVFPPKVQILTAA
ncbi:MAG TPA: DUF5647 family protein [Anaerolineae bacterium]|nr:DUF5647 family protein [Anaerolineae bacterium]